MKKKFIFILLSVILVTCLMFSVACDKDNLSSNENSNEDPSHEVPENVLSQDANDDWTFDETVGKLVIKGTGDMADYSETNSPWQDYKTGIKSIEISDGVTRIGNNAFHNCTSLTSVTVSDSVKSIGENAFCNCPIETAIIPAMSCEYVQNSELKTVIITSGNSITAAAFKDCVSLTNITIPDSITSIDDDAFYGCSKLQYNEYDNGYYLGNENNPYLVLIKAKSEDINSFNIHNSTRIIYASALSDIMSLTSVTIPESVASIGSYAFDCELLKNVYYDGDIAGWCNISFGSFTANPLFCGSDLYTKVNGEYELATDIVIPEGVTSIGRMVFSKYVSLKSVTIPESVTSIGEDAFCECTSLTSVTVSDGAMSIGSSAFRGCTSLTSVYYDGDISGWCNITFGNESANPLYTDFANPLYKVVKLYTKVDGEYVQAKDLVIPETVTEIKAYVFVTCTSLTSVYYDGDISGWCNITFGNGFSNPLYYAHNLYTKVNGEYVQAKDLVIPDTVTEIKPFAFNGSALERVTIGNGVKIIGASVFSECKSLESVTTSDSVTSIGMYAFSKCTSLESITISDSVTNLGAYSFRNCTSLTSITIGKNVTSVDKDAFSFCKSLTDVNYNGDKASWDMIAFGNETSNPLCYGATLHTNDDN